MDSLIGRLKICPKRQKYAESKAKFGRATESILRKLTLFWTSQLAATGIFTVLSQSDYMCERSSKPALP
jgi:hypothetical protein